MPVVDGLKATRELKQKFEKLNKVENENETKEKWIIRPLICHLTQYDEGFKSFITEDEKADLFLRKPLTHIELANLLRLL